MMQYSVESANYSAYSKTPTSIIGEEEIDTHLKKKIMMLK